MVFLFGPYDLSISMGIPAQFNHPDFKKALDRIVKACKRAGKPIFIFAGTREAAKAHLAKGFDGVAVGTDVSVLVQAYRKIVAEIEE